MLKVSTFQAETEFGPSAIPLFGAAENVFEKVAAHGLLPDVVRYIEGLKPQKGSQYVLVNAMGASEFFGSNINGDAFPEASLIHSPDNWTGNPVLDKIRAKDWPYGFPTFYGAHPYAHHRNKDASRAFGEVELAVWHPKMKRVELVTRVDQDKCEKFGGVAVWDKLHMGQFPDVSMGTKVPYDTCSICLDWDTYRKAQATFRPGVDKHPGDAVLRWHKAKRQKDGKGIRGVSITRKDYCDHASKMMNRILPDGRKVFVYNDYPKFFDISFVFIGADRTAKTMLKIAGGGRVYSLPSAEVAEKLGYDESAEVLEPAFVMEKAASVPDEDLLKTSFLGKLAKNKSGEMTKDVVPSQFTGKAVPLLTRSERDLPKALLDLMGSMPLEKSLSTTSGLGMVLRPREFQRIILISIGKPGMADRYEDEDVVFPKCEDSLDLGLSSADFHLPLARLLLPLLAERSALGPHIEKRVLVASGKKPEQQSRSSSHPSDVLHKMSAAYNSYRSSVMELIPNTQNFLGELAGPNNSDLYKIASASASDVFTSLSAAYIRNAFLDEFGQAAETKLSQAFANVERVTPSRNTSRATTQRRM